LSKATEQAGGTCCVDHAAVLLLLEVWPRSSCALVCSFHMDFHNLKADVAQNAGVVDEHVDSAKGLDGGFDNPVTILNRVVVCSGLAAGRCDLLDDLVGGLGRDNVSARSQRKNNPSEADPLGSESTHLVTTALTLEGATQVVDDNIGSSRCEEQCVCSSKSSASAGHDDGLAIVA
jgi:hypothetical protein